MHVETVGSGPRVVLVHGSVGSGWSTRWAQRPLEERFTLVVPDRPGTPPNPPVDHVDFEEQAPLVAGWRVEGWAIAAVLWIAVHAVELLLTRMRVRVSNLAASGVQAFGMFFKALGLLVVLVATAASDPKLALAAALTYALAYTFELGLSLLAYFGGAT